MGQKLCQPNNQHLRKDKKKFIERGKKNNVKNIAPFIRYAFSFLLVVALVCFSIQPASALAQDNSVIDGPSETFIDLYTKLFTHTETYKLLDSENNCITELFINEHKNEFDAGDFRAIWDAVLDGNYSLMYGTPEVIEIPSVARAASSTVTVSSAWVYKLESLSNLLKDKTVEFAYRVVGTYTYNTSTYVITSYQQPTLDFTITHPGDLFPYTMSQSKNASLNSSSTIITFSATFSLTFSYAYSATPTQTLGPYTPRVVSNPQSGTV